MRQSNLYIITYAAIVTVVCGGLLAYTSISLKDRQAANIALEKKGNILGTVFTLKEGDDIGGMFAKRIKPMVVDTKGQELAGLKPEDISVENEYKKPAAERRLPVYAVNDEQDPNKIAYVVLPLYGNGLWNKIWGYIALKHDCNTIQGIVLEHAGETPGLGARIASKEIQDRYKGKQIFDDQTLLSVDMQKGEGKDYVNDPHKVDGMSGATITGKGVNNMLKDYLSCYEAFLKKIRTQN